MAGQEEDQHESVGAWAKQYYYASRTMMESTLRRYGLGSTQWYVLYQLANEGPTKQRDLGQLLRIERATLSGIVATLVRKGLVEQLPDPADQRQRVLRLTAAGTALWNELPDPIAIVQAVSFGEADPGELAIALRVLKTATHRLNAHVAVDTKR